MKIFTVLLVILGAFFIGGCDSFPKNDTSHNQSGIEYKRPKPEQLQQASINLIRKYGSASFLDELYRLIGNAPDVVVTSVNVAIFSELGFHANNKQIPFAIEKSAINKVFGEADFNFTVATIREAVLAKGKNAGLDKVDIWFLSWVFSPTPKLSSNLARNEVMGIGWNCELHSATLPQVHWVTFGAYLCTVILAEGADGAWSASHYDTLPYNPEQISLLDKFSTQHGGLKRFYLINWRPEHIRILSEKWPTAELLLANKSNKDVWFISFSFLNGSVSGRYSQRRVSDEWLGSLYPKNQAIDFRKSKLAFMLPRPETEWNTIEFKKMAPKEFFKTKQ